MKKIKTIFTITFIIIIYTFMFITLTNNNEISTVEKRTLTTFPKFSLKTLINGTYLDTLTTAFSDQIAFRDKLVKGYYLFQFQRYNGDVVKGKNNELYSAYQRINNEDTYLENVRQSTYNINKVADKVTTNNTKFIFLSIPRKDAVEKDNLPNSYISSDTIYNKSIDVVKQNLSNNVILIDAYELFDDKNIRYYYTNDHHITPRGANILYNKIKQATNDNRLKQNNLEDLYTIEKTIINGSFNNQLGQSVKPSLEELYLVPKFNINYTRYEDLKVSNKKVYGKGNNYEDSYMEGDNAFTIIDTNRKDLPNILYVGSSFTNILEALSIHDFNKMISIDYRHNTSKNSINYYVKTYNIDYVVFIPSQSNDAFSYNMIKKHLGM